MKSAKMEYVFQIENIQLKCHYYVFPIPLNLVPKGTGVLVDFVREILSSLPPFLRGALSTSQDLVHQDTAVIEECVRKMYLHSQGPVILTDNVLIPIDASQVTVSLSELYLTRYNNSQS